MGSPRPSKDGSAARDRAAARLKRLGLRVTAPRIAVLKVLDDTTHALTAYDIHSRVLDSGGSVDIVSVYRTLASFKECGLIHYIGSVDGYLACRLEEPHAHHAQHFVCSHCRKVVESDLPQGVAEASLSSMAAAGFVSGTVHVEVVGACQDCGAPA